MATSHHPKIQRRWVPSRLLSALGIYTISLIILCRYAILVLDRVNLELGHSVLVVSSEHDALDAAMLVFKRMGALPVPLNSNSGRRNLKGGGAVLVHTTDLLHSIPPGIQVVYFLPSPVKCVGNMIKLSDAESASEIRNKSACGLRSWASHYHHWRLLTRHWNNTLLVLPMEQFCSVQAASQLISFLGVTGMAANNNGLCGKQQAAQVAISSAERQLRSIGGNDLMDFIDKTSQSLLEVNGTDNALHQQSECRNTGRRSHFTNVSAPFAEYSHSQFAPMASTTARGKRTINLLNTYFPSKAAKRKTELDEALLANYNNPYVDQLHVFIDGKTTSADVPLDQQQIGKRVQVIHTQKQPTYAQLAAYANEHLQGQIVIMHNVDCVFTDSVQLFHKMAATDVYALSRQQSQYAAYADCEDKSIEYRNQCYQYGGSHDAFGFQPPIAQAVVDALQYKQNAWFADQKTVAVFEFYNFSVSNPCYDIVLLHHHCSNIRGDPRTGPGALPERPYGYGFIPPTHVNSSHPTWMYNLQERVFYEV